MNAISATASSAGQTAQVNPVASTAAKSVARDGQHNHNNSDPAVEPAKYTGLVSANKLDLKA
jgi:hypothetical protein